MTEEEARLKLADELISLADSLRDPSIGGGIVKNLLGGRRQLRLEALLGDNKTLIAIQEWTEEELEEMKRKALEEDEWPEFVYVPGM